MCPVLSALCDGSHALLLASTHQCIVQATAPALQVVISWIFSPVASGIIAAIFFLLVRVTILRSSNSFSRAWWALPILVGVCFFINSFYVIDKGGVAKEFEFETPCVTHWLSSSLFECCMHAMICMCS